MSIAIRQLKPVSLSQFFFWLFLICLPFNKRVIYQIDSAYIDGYFSYYLAIFLYLSDILLFLCFTAWIVENWANLRQKNVLIDRKYAILALLFVISGLLTWFPVKHLDLLAIYSLIKVWQFIFLIWFVAKQANIRQTAIIVYISGIFQAILAIWQFHVQRGLGLTWIGEYVAPLGTGGLAMLNTVGGKVLRAYGTFPHPNILAAFLLVSLIFGYWLVSRETSIKRRIWLEVGNFLLILGIFLTFSRVAWITAAMITAAFISFTWNYGDRKRTGTLIFVGIVACATILILWNSLLFSRISEDASTNSYTERGEYNQIGLDIIKKMPWGTGFGNYIPAMAKLYPLQPWEYQPPHNIFIYIAATTGILGLIIFLVVLLKIFSSLWRSENSELKFVLLVLGISLIFMSLFDHFLVTIQQGQLLFFTVLGLLLNYTNKILSSKS